MAKIKREYIENVTGQVQTCQWDGVPYDIPVGKHLVSELFPGQEHLAAHAAAKLGGSEPKVKVFVEYETVPDPPAPPSLEDRVAALEAASEPKSKKAAKD